MSLGTPAPAREPGRTERKREAILAFAEDIFLARGYDAASMDEIAAQAEVSKQTIYKQFGSKDALFLEIIGGMTGAASDDVQREIRTIGDADDIVDALTLYAERQLRVVLNPKLMQLRRLVIAEATRFPELGETLYRQGPGRAIAALAEIFARWAARGLLQIDDPILAATQFNWIVMGEPVNRVMFLGNGAIPAPATLRGQAAEGVRLFLAAYGRPAT